VSPSTFLDRPTTLRGTLGDRVQVLVQLQVQVVQVQV
jgi:hypothetical protein